MQYPEFKAHFVRGEYQGPELYHFWIQGLTVDQAREKLRARGRVAGVRRGISDLNLRLGLAKAIILWCDRMGERRLTDAQRVFVDAARERATRI